MKFTAFLLSLLCSLLITQSAQAEMYKWEDKQGNIIYSDTPPYKGAKPLEPPELTTTPAIKVPKEKPKKKKKPPFRYKSFSITSPAHDSTVRDNEGNISVRLKLDPGLNKEQKHSITVLLDGKEIKNKLQGSSVTLHNVDRGTHSISAQIKNGAGKVVKSAKTVTVHLRRHSVLHKPPN